MIRHLHIIKHNLLSFAEVCYAIDYDTSKTAESVMAATATELLHLRQKPSLFPSKDVEEEFWQFTYRINRHLEIAHAAIIAHLKELDLLQAASTEESLELLLPRRDKRRKPWEHFFHNMAPGSKIDFSKVLSEGGSAQVLPMGALRILMAMHAENNSIIRDIEAVGDISLCRRGLQKCNSIERIIDRSFTTLGPCQYSEITYSFRECQDSIVRS